MINLREMTSRCRTSILVLLVLFAFGMGVPGNSYAKTEMQNGHEGDPTDGDDVIAGGGGDNPGNEHSISQPVESDSLPIWGNGKFGFNGQLIVLVPIFEYDRIVWTMAFYSLAGGWK